MPRGQLSALSPELFAAIAFLASTTLAYAESPKVVASFKPVHSLVASVMEGIGTPYLLVKGSASPHTYTMTPSDAEALQSAQAVFWIGHDMEAFLDKPLEALGIKAKIAALNKIKGLTTLPLREGGAFDAHEGEGEPAAEDHAHDHGEADPHLWLDPENAELMVKEIAATLSALDPANAAAYEINAKKTLTDLDAVTVELAVTLAPVKGKPFLTFHDAFQYFESRFGLSAAGSISVNPDTPPGAARIAELQAKVKSLGATCVFSEPNFEPKLINVVIEGTNAKTAALDPEASALPEGPDLYAQSLRGIAAAMRECLDS